MLTKHGNKEIRLLREIAGNFPRHPKQVNSLLESDAEIIDFKNENVQQLVVKVDGIHEEIREKLYEDPYLIGWMAVTVTISDLAAVGATPFGLLLTLQLPEHRNATWLNSFQKGVNAACSAYQVYILGGDTNFDTSVSVSTSAIGTITNSHPLLRKPIYPGDLIYSTGKLGVGNAFAYSRYFDPSIVVHYQPLARVKESRLIQQYATSCIDTSDGLFPALSVLSELNTVGFQLNDPLQEMLHRHAIPVYSAFGIPAWMLMAGPHGEYELLFSIPPERKIVFETACTLDDWQPVYLGSAIRQQVVSFSSENVKIECEPAFIANQFSEAQGDVHSYFKNLMKQHCLWSQ